MAKKKLKDLKKSKDFYFRRRAKQQTLAPVTDVNLEIRQKVKTIKGTKKQVQSQKNKIKSLEKENRKTRDKIKELEVRFTFEDDEGKKRIEEDLKQYRIKSLVLEKNQLRALEGKDFNFVVDDGFKRYFINTRELKKYWKKGKDASILILKKMGKNTEEAISYYANLIEKEKNTASKSRMKKLNRIKDGLVKKLRHTIKQNIAAVESGDMSELDEVSDDDEKSYSLLFKVVGVNIDRIGI